MATSNFSRIDRADSIYAVLMGDVDEFDRDLLIDDLTETFKSNKFTILNEWNSSCKNGMFNLAKANIWESYGDIDIKIECFIHLESGYYEGAKLDFTFYLYTNYCGYQRIDDDDDLKNTINELFTDCSYMNKGLQVIQSRNAYKSTQKQIEQLSLKVNELLKSHSEIELILIGTFSNGEAIYKKK